MTSNVFTTCSTPRCADRPESALLSVLCCEVGKRVIGILIEDVVEIVAMASLSLPPGMPSSARGVLEP